MAPFKWSGGEPSGSVGAAHLSVPLRAERDDVHEATAPLLASWQRWVKHLIHRLQVLQRQGHAVAILHVPQGRGRLCTTSVYLNQHTQQLGMRLLQPIDLVFGSVLPRPVYEIIAKHLLLESTKAVTRHHQTTRAHRASGTRHSAHRPLRAIVLVYRHSCFRPHIRRYHLQQIELAGYLEQRAAECGVANEKRHISRQLLVSVLNARGTLEEEEEWRGEVRGGGSDESMRAGGCEACHSPAICRADDLDSRA